MSRPDIKASTTSPSSTFHSTSVTHSMFDAGTIIAIILGVGIFITVIAMVRKRRETARTVHVSTAPPARLDFAPLRAAMPEFSRFAFEETAASLVRSELASRGGTVLVADIRPTLVDANQIVCTIEASAGGAYNIGRWTFVRAGDSWKVGKYEDISVGRGPQLVGAGPELGNDLPTLTDDQAIVRFGHLRDEDKSTSWDGFVARVRETYAKLNEAWNKQDVAGVSSYVTPRLTEWLQFWYGEYQRQGLVNRHTDAEIRHIGLAQVTRELAVDAVTVRVYAKGFDVTTKAGEIVSGSDSEKREYTEYWTFVRAKGAPDWRLTKIEQDELYAG